MTIPGSNFAIKVSTFFEEFFNHDPATNIIADDIKVDFTLNADSIHRRTTELVQAAQRAYDAIATIPDDRKTFENTAKAMALVEGYFSTISSSLTFLQFVSTNKLTRDACVEANKTLDEFSIEIGMREDIFRAIKYISGFPDLTNNIEKRLVDKILLGFQRSGLELEKQSDKDLLKAYRKRLSKLEIEFSSTIAEDNTVLVFSRSQLYGLTERHLQGFEHITNPVSACATKPEKIPQDLTSGKNIAAAACLVVGPNEISNEQKTCSGIFENDSFKVTMKYPDYFAIMKYCKVVETRKVMKETYSSRCPANGERLIEALKIRHEAALLLGYPNHGSFQLANKMAKKSSEVLLFLEKISHRLSPLIEKEHLALLEEKNLETNQSETTLEDYDFAYYNRIQQEKIGVDENSISLHFPLSQVLEKMLEIYERVLSLKFKEIKDHPTIWHPDVKLFQVLNSSEPQSLVGYFYIDLFPREGKYTHAACFPVQPGMSLDANETISLTNEENIEHRLYPVAAMVANFSKPDSKGSSYLTHHEVVTLFHELGHVMHHVCSKTSFSRFHGTSVEGDFVEAPSQMLENWCWNEEILTFLSTPTPIPSDSLKALMATKLLNTGFQYRRQIFFGLFDMHIHTNVISSTQNLTYEQLVHHWKELRHSLTGIKESPITFEGNTFGHLMGGYDAGYYGYLWSLVLSADFFEAKFSKNIFDPLAGLEYRSNILEPGSSRDAIEMVELFLGRPFNEDAFCKSIGIA